MNSFMESPLKFRMLPYKLQSTMVRDIVNDGEGRPMGQNGDYISVKLRRSAWYNDVETFSPHLY